ncbi:MAG: hypothetical protein HYY06_09690 [Deltaproteobacteria bacterium]|nr:hypothetical protein [Deltaproteobacteria bacterium]
MTACTERAVLVAAHALDLAQERRCDRVYLGSETCELLIPTAPQIRRFLQGTDGRTRLTVVTPPCTDEGLARIERLLDALPAGTEVVFNDWGVLELLRAGFRPVMGRLLLTVRRGFRRGGLSRLAPEMTAFLRHSNLESPELQAFLVESGVSRVELDNVVQGLSLRLDPAFRASLYLPYVYIASGRKCLFQRMATGSDEAYRSGAGCGLPCRDLSLWGVLGDPDERVLVSENAHYYENAVLPADLEALNVDRIVDCSSLSRPARAGQAGEPGTREGM